MNKQFNPKKIDRLNDPGRLMMIPPEYVWKLLKPCRHADKVEIGAGAGIFSRAFQRLSGMGKTIALDISEVMIDWMVENISAEYPDVIPMKTDGLTLPLADDSTDLIFMITVHHELDDPKSMLDESRRILRNTGRICIIDWSPSELSMGGPPAEIRCNPEDVCVQLKEAGFNTPVIDEGIRGFFLITADC